MKVFSSITELQNEIKLDKNTRESYANRYPIRLLFLPSVQMVKEIVKILDYNGVERIDLASFLPFDDGWLLVQELIKKIEGLDKNKDFIIAPFSEVARFYDRDGFGHLFNALAALENDKENLSRRIYIPLVGIYERFKNEFYDNFYRKENWAPIWQIKTDGYSKIKIFITDRFLKSAPHIEIVHNTKDWLELWKKDNTEKIICVSKTLTHLYPNRLPDNVFDIDRIENPKELLSKIYEIKLPIEFKDNERLLWDNLFDIFIEKDFRDLEEAVRKVFNVVNIELKDILRLWFASNRIFDKWLLKHCVIQKQDWRNTYIYIILSSSDSLDDNALIENIWFKIFELNNKTLYCDERNSLLRHLYIDKEVPAYFEQRLVDKFAEIKNPREKIRLLTGITSYERSIALELFASGEIDIRLLNEKYPDIAYYLSDIIPENLNENTFWVENYFKEYRFSKLRDKISANLNEILNEKNKNKDQFYQWYYSFETAHQILERENVDKILLIDALGIEWLPLLCHFIERDLSLHVEKKCIARAYLPTITECNKFQNALHIYDFDKDVHSSEPYKYPDSIIKDIDLIKKIIYKHLTISGQERIAIVSDHGSTALARLKENIKVYDFQDANHEGRCMWINNNDFLEDDDFIIHNIENPDCGSYSKCLIALKYTSLYRRPLREVHGGATPEEVLIPVIIISKQSRAYQQDFEIILDKTKISKKEPFLLLTINPKPDIMPLLTDQTGKSFSFEYDKNSHKWKVNIRELKTGKQNIKIKIGEWEKTFNIEIIGGMKEREIL